jgi:hypothetical protein
LTPKHKANAHHTYQGPRALRRSERTYSPDDIGFLPRRIQLVATDGMAHAILFDRRPSAAIEPMAAPAAGVVRKDRSYMGKAKP